MTLISKVDTRLIVDKHSARELRSERNKLAPISILPPEILAAIFYFASIGQIETWELSPMPCYYFTHVSQSWRSVALTTPNLWQVLPQSLRWADIFLERSKGVADLVVRQYFLFMAESSKIMFLKGVLENHTSRIRELVLSHVEKPTLATLLEDLPQCSLRLQVLKLSSYESVPERQATFPIGLLETGNLRSFSVHYCIIRHWYSLSLPALTSLTLDHILDRPPLINFLQILRGAPSLCNLVMKYSLPLANDLVSRVGFESVHLPNLRWLTLRSTGPKELINILDFIIVPPTATLQLSTRFTSEEAETIGHEFVSSLLKILGRIQQGTESSYGHLNLGGCNGWLRLNAGKDEIMPWFLELGLYIPGLDYISNLLQQIISSFPFFNIRSLNLEFSSLPVDPFARLPHLENISVSGDCTAELIRALRCKPDNYNTEPVMSFPVLQSLCVYRYSFLGRSAGVEDLQGCLMERRERKAGLSKLTLTDCNIRAGDVEQLREVVNELEWHPYGNVTVWY